MSTLRRISLLMALLSVVLFSSNTVVVVQATSSEEPSTARISASFSHGESVAQPDIDIMARELDWAMANMKKYQKLRGGLPVRHEESSSDSQDDAKVETKESKLRGRSERSRPATAEEDYWEKLITVF